MRQTYFFSPKAQKALCRFLSEPALLGFDLDGTLAPIVISANKVRIRREVLQGLKKLALEYPVTVISGRAKRDMTHLLGRTPFIIIGNHGLEGNPFVKNSVDSTFIKSTVRSWMRTLAPFTESRKGSLLENKTLTLSIHFRHVRDKTKFKKEFCDILPKLSPRPRVIPGKQVFNLVPPHSPDKGHAIMALRRSFRCQHAFYIGDDITDEDVFKLRKTGLFTVHVGKSSQSRAKYYIKNQNDIGKVIESINSCNRAKARINFHEFEEEL